jgi:arsenate reductase
MSHGFLQSFDKNLQVFSAGTEPAKQVNATAVKVMQEIGIDISKHTPKMVDQYIKDEWDYIITVCDHANETCPLFMGKVKQRLHIGFDDPSHTVGTDEFIMSEFHRVRDEIKKEFYKLYVEQIKPQL